jgi:hypothetical protein
VSRAAGTVLERLRLVEDDPTLLVRLGDGSIAKYVPPELVTAAADEIDRLRAAVQQMLSARAARR